MTSRPIVAIALGALIGLIVSGFLGWLGDYVFPPSVLADMNPQLARSLPMPVGEVVMQLVGWTGGVALGSILALRFSDEIDQWICWAVAAVFEVACVIFAFLSPHPVWFVGLCVVAIAVAGYLSGRLLIREADSEAAPYFPPEPQTYPAQPEPQPEPDEEPPAT